MEKLDYSKRILRVRAMGEECGSSDPAIAAHANLIITELEKGRFYERQLVLLSCSASKNKEQVTRLTKDRSAIIRRMAAKFSATICDEEDLLVLLASRKGKERRLILKQLNREGRSEIVDAFLRQLAITDQTQLRQLLFFGTEDLVKEFLPELAEQLSAEDMSRFAYRYPDLCADFLERASANIEREDPAFRRLVQGAFTWISNLRPDRALVLLKKLLKLYPANQLSLSALLVLRSAEAVSILAEQPDYGGANISFILHKLPEALLLKAVELKQNASSVLYCFDKIPAGIRQKVYEKCGDAWRNSNGAIPANVLEKLPRQTRIAEAKKSLAIANLSSQLSERIYYVRLLDWDYVKKETQDSLNNPDLDTRSLAFFNLIASLKFNREGLPELLELLHKRKNEPDPVRLQFFSALAILPPSIFEKEVIPALETIMDDALKAHDLSNSTLYQIGKLLSRMFPFDRDWVATRQLALLRNRGQYPITSNKVDLTDDDAKLLASKWKPVIEYWESKEKENELCQLAAWFGERLRFFDELSDALCRMTKQAKNTCSSESALRVLYNNHHDRFKTLLPELLKLDPSWSLNRQIITYLSAKRQSMLTPYLGQTAFHGRFSTGKNRIVPDFTAGFHRWTTAQIDIYKNELSVLAESESSNHNDKVFAVYRLSRMPEPKFKLLDRIASLDNKDEAVRDCAIRNMSKLDDGSGLPILLSFLNDDRARLAIYAMRSAVLNIEAAQALEILRAVPRNKVTVFKEVLRLAGDTTSKEAFDWFCELESEDLHRDVRVALLRALWNFPEQDKTWEILRRTVASGDPVYADVAIRYPTASLSKMARKNLLHLFNDALQSSDLRSRIKTLSAISSSTLLDPEMLVFDSIKKSLASDADFECGNAAAAVATLYFGRRVLKLDSLLQAVISKPRNLRILMQQLQLRTLYQKNVYADDVRILCGLLSQHPVTAELKLNLAGSTLPMIEFFSMLKEAENSKQLHYGVMESTIHILSENTRLGADYLSEIEAKLSAEKSESLRRLGLAALCGLGNSATGWTPERLQKLRSYRKDPALVVCSAAQFTLPSAELLEENGAS